VDAPKEEKEKAEKGRKNRPFPQASTGVETICA